MNKKCGKCGWYSDKCKNPENIHYNEFRDREDRCNNKSSQKFNKDKQENYMETILKKYGRNNR